jgi:hypothetical protein
MELWRKEMCGGTRMSESLFCLLQNASGSGDPHYPAGVNFRVTQIMPVES